MTLLDTLAAALEAVPGLTGGAWVDANTAEPPATPFVVFQEMPSSTNNTLDGPTDLQNTRVQVDIYDPVRATVESLKAPVAAAVAGAFPQSVQTESSDLYEPDTKLRRTSLIFSIWSAL